MGCFGNANFNMINFIYVFSLAVIKVGASSRVGL